MSDFVIAGKRWSLREKRTVKKLWRPKRVSSFFRRNNGIIEGPKYFPGSALRESQNVHAAVLGFDLCFAVRAPGLEPPSRTHEAKISGTFEFLEFWDPSARLLWVGDIYYINILVIRIHRICV